MPNVFIGKHTKRLAALFLFLLVTSCSPALTPEPAYQAATVIQTVEVTREVTSEVTRLVDIPVTDTPTPTPDWTATPTLTPTRTLFPSATPTWTPPKVRIIEHSACLYGPGWAYLYKYGLAATVWMRVIGRNSEGTWLFVRAGVDPDWNGCWIETNRVEFLSGAVSDVPVYWMGLPGSSLYLPPVAVSASRVGNEVIVSWQAVWMTEDDYRGYLIEAWVCQGGKQVFLPIGHPAPLPMPSVWENTGVFSVTIIDEPGCSIPTTARIYSVEKHGYTYYRMIPWPPYETFTSPTITSTP
jgi:hypothetical protein